MAETMVRPTKLTPLIEVKLALVREGLSVSGLALQLGITRVHLGEVLLMRRAPSDELRARIGKKIGERAAALLKRRSHGPASKVASATRRSSIAETRVR